jgi:protein-tyrosine phosphatase
MTGSPSGAASASRRDRSGRSPFASLRDSPAPDSSAETELTILTVCTGNICRSPLAEVLLRARLPGATVHSAGTHALVGHPMTDEARDIAVAAGATAADASAHSARTLNERMLTGADLVLTMSASHRTHAIRMTPGRLRQTFTAREFARLAATLSDEEIRSAADTAGAGRRARAIAALRLIGERRGLALSATEDDDVIDPYRRSRATYERSAAQLVPALDEIVRFFRAAQG